MLRTLELIQGLVGVLVLLVVVVLCVRRTLGRAGRRRAPRTGNVLEVMDEVFSPARHAAAVELRTHEDQGPVLPADRDD